jgi:hypothetical protein
LTRALANAYNFCHRRARLTRPTIFRLFARPFPHRLYSQASGFVSLTGNPVFSFIHFGILIKIDAGAIVSPETLAFPVKSPFNDY